MYSKKGFFSSQIDCIRHENQQNQSKIFLLAFKTFEEANSRLDGLNIYEHDKKSCLLTALFCKILESYNATLLLSNYGLLCDSKSILRVLIEAVFQFGAIVNDDNGDNYEQFLFRGSYETNRLIERIKDNPNKFSKANNMQFSNINQDAFHDNVSKYRRKYFEPKNMAKKAGMLDLYINVYPSVSEDVHSNINSLFEYFVFKDQHVEAINTSPKYENQPFVLITAILVLIRAIKVLDCYSNINNKDSIKKLEDELEPYLDLL